MRRRLGRIDAALVLLAAAAVLTRRIDAMPQATHPSPLIVTAKARSVRPGELVVLTVAARSDISEVRARAFDRDLPAFAVDARTWRVLVGIDLEVAPRSYPIEIIA